VTSSRKSEKINETSREGRLGVYNSHSDGGGEAGEDWGIKGSRRPIRYGTNEKVREKEKLG